MYNSRDNQHSNEGMLIYPTRQTELWLQMYEYYTAMKKALNIAIQVQTGGQRFTDFYCTSFKTNICVNTEGAL